MGAPARWLRQFAWLVLILLGLYALLEVSLRVYDSRTGQITQPDRFGKGLITRSWHLHHELKPLEQVAQRNPDTGERVKLSINSLGLRGPEIAVPKPPGAYRVLCLGDDATFGNSVEESDQLAARLREQLQQQTRLRVEVINAAVPGYCPLLSCLQFRHRLAGLQPDLVILHFDMSDVADDYRVRRDAVSDADDRPLACPHPDLARSAAAAKESAANWLLAPDWAKAQLARVWTQHALPATARRIDTAAGKYLWLEDHPPDWSVYVRQTLEPCATLRDLCRGMHADFVLAVHPAPWQVSATACADPTAREAAGVAGDACYRSRTPFDSIAAFCQERHLPLLDVSGSFLATPQPDGLFFQRTPYFTPAGHRRYAEAVADYLIQERPGPWRDLPASPVAIPVGQRGRGALGAGGRRNAGR